MVVANTEFPERNLSFLIHVVPEMNCKEHITAGVHISCISKINDCETCEATMAGPQSVLVKVPSRTGSQREIEHIVDNVLECSGTQNSFKKAYYCEDEEARACSYYLIIFPDSISLDNMRFSGDYTNVVKEMKGITVKAEDRTAANMVMVHWYIAIHGGRRTNNQSKKVAAKSLFN